MKWGRTVIYDSPLAALVAVILARKCFDVYCVKAFPTEYYASNAITTKHTNDFAHIIEWIKLSFTLEGSELTQSGGKCEFIIKRCFLLYYEDNRYYPVEQRVKTPKQTTLLY